MLLMYSNMKSVSGGFRERRYGVCVRLPHCACGLVWYFWGVKSSSAREIMYSAGCDNTAEQIMQEGVRALTPPVSCEKGSSRLPDLPHYRTVGARGAKVRVAGSCVSLCFETTRVFVALASIAVYYDKLRR